VSIGDKLAKDKKRGGIYSDFSVELLLVVFMRLPGEAPMKVHVIPGVPSSGNASDASD
jgi:hypothetical protein